MNETELSSLSARYVAALQTHFEQGRQVNLQASHDLGGAAVTLGLETLDLARIHDHALAVLIPPDCSSAARDGMMACAAVFFTEAITPIEETHRAAQEATTQMMQLNATLEQRTVDLADSNRELKEGIMERKTAEAALKARELASSQLLTESRLLEQHLQDMARNILAANEAERKKMSLQLQDEIAQALLGIHVRLLSLKKEAASNQAGLTAEIATTQRLVEESVKTINRFAREFGIHHES